MTRIKTTSRIAAALAALAVTAACSDRAERGAGAAGRDAATTADRAGNAASDAAKNIGAAVETMDVKMALAADARVDASHINVDTDHVTKTVTLKGRVPSAAQKFFAEVIANEKAHGYTVRNTLVVVAP
jgi:osmotically-inducible protein OsmY